MSILSAILFYSTRDAKSMRLKTVAENLEADLETLCVDHKQVRERLLNDEKYGIDRVPSVLLVYTSGQHKVFIGQALDAWFNQLIENIQLYHQEQEMLTQQQFSSAATMQYTPVSTLNDPVNFPNQEQGDQMSGVPKELRMRPTAAGAAQMRGSLPTPGRAPPQSTSLIDEPFLPEPHGGPGSFGGMPGAQSAMIAEHIKPPEQPKKHNQAGESTPPVSKGVTKSGPTAKQIAEQMQAEQERLQEEQKQMGPLIQGFGPPPDQQAQQPVEQTLL